MRNEVRCNPRAGPRGEEGTRREARAGAHVRGGAKAHRGPLTTPWVHPQVDAQVDAQVDVHVR